MHKALAGALIRLAHRIYPPRTIDIAEAAALFADMEAGARFIEDRGYRLPHPQSLGFEYFAPRS